MPKLKIEHHHKKRLNKCLEIFHKSIIFPLRCSMIETHRCYICDKLSDGDASICSYLKSYERQNLVAYLSCDKCKSIVPLLLDLYEETGNYIPNSIYDGYDINHSNIHFFRKSGSADIKPYVEREASIDIKAYPVFHKTKENRLHILVFWTVLVPNIYGSDKLTKTISLANAIHHNRSIFGYKLSQGPLSRCASIWKEYIKKEYIIANAFNEFLNIIYKTNNFDGLIKTLIYEYWMSNIL